MSIAPLFPGYAEIPAPADDPLWRKWLTVRSAPDVEHAPVELSCGDVARFNAQVNRDVHYLAEPRGADEWQTPAQTMSALSGDCEDISILKYAVMRRSGLPEAAMRIVLGQIQGPAGRLDHAWLALFLEDAWRVLDNKFDQLIAPQDYINWLPAKALWSDQVALFGRQMTINEILARHG
ncbi:MAG TPA: transglutaminase domain-containing protein [Pseudolabrys sp.]|nr:transglutaminase domain-containing protein [Pseudolabrys sp.]